MAVLKGGLLLKREVPIGVIDGVNALFATSRPYIAGTLMVYLNGLLLSPGDDYTETDNTTCTLTAAPQTEGSYVDKLIAVYQIA